MDQEPPTPSYVADDETDMYNVEESGWYLFNDNFKAVDGPFFTREDAVAAI